MATALPALAQSKPMPADKIQITKPIYPWKTETEYLKDKNGKSSKNFSHCQVKNMYDNGILLLIAENTAHARRMALYFPQDKMPPNERFELDWQVDQNPPRQIRAVSASPRILAIALDDPMTKEMAAGYSLALRGPNDALVFGLNGVADATDSLRNCLIGNGVKPAPIHFAAAPLAANPPDSKQPGSKLAALAEQKVAAPVASVPAPAAQPVKPGLVSLPAGWHDLFTRAGLPPRNVTPVPASAGGAPVDLVWAKMPLVIGLKHEGAIPHQALVQTATRFTDTLRQLCGGEFLAEAGQVQQRGTRYVLPVEAACAPAQASAQAGKNTIAALLFVLDAPALTTIFIEAPQANGADAIQARDKVLAQVK